MTDCYAIVVETIRPRERVEGFFRVATQGTLDTEKSNFLAMVCWASRINLHDYVRVCPPLLSVANARSNSAYFLQRGNNAAASRKRKERGN